MYDNAALHRKCELRVAFSAGEERIVLKTINKAKRKRGAASEAPTVYTMRNASLRFVV
jgi:hypothetical protein